MASATVEDKINLMNKLARALAKEEGITEVQALARIKKEFMDREEAADTLRGMSVPRTDYSGGNGQKIPSEDAYGLYSEQSKIELKRLDIQQRQLDLDQKRADAEARKQEYLEKKLDAEEKHRQEELKIERDRQREEANFNRLMLVMNIGGKKGGDKDEFMEYLKSQTESTKEFYKAQGEGQKNMYETLFRAKEAEQNREFEWKKELAKIESEREIEFEKLRRSTDSQTASSTEALVNMLAERFDNFAEQNKKTGSMEDIAKKIEEFEKFNKTIAKAGMNILKAQGFSEDQLAAVKSVVESEEDRQKSTIGRVWEVGKEVLKRILPAELTPEQQLEQQKIQAEQARLARERDEKIRKDVEVEAARLQADNAKLEQEKERLRLMGERQRVYEAQYLEQRKTLIAKAMQLDIPVTDGMDNEQIFVAIERREAELYKQRQERLQIEEKERQEREQEKQNIPAEQPLVEQQQDQPVPEGYVAEEPHDEPHEEPKPPPEEPKPEVTESSGTQQALKDDDVREYKVTGEDGAPVGAGTYSDKSHYKVALRVAMDIEEGKTVRAMISDGVNVNKYDVSRHGKTPKIRRVKK